MLNKGKIYLYCDRVILAFLCLAIFCLPFSKAGVESFVWPAIFIFILKRALGYRTDSALRLIPKTELNWALGVFIAMNALALTFSADFGLSLRAFLGKWLKFLMIYFMLVEVIISKRRMNILLMTILASALLILADAGVQYYRGVDFLRGYPWTKLAASFSSANDFAGWLIVIIPLFSGLLLSGKGLSKGLKVLLLLLIMLLFICLLASYARGAWLGFIVGIFFMVWHIIRSLRIKLLIFSAVICLLAVFIMSPPYIQDKVSVIGRINFKDAGTLNARIKSVLNPRDIGRWVRLGLWKEALRIIKDYNFTGCGLNTYTIVARDYKSFNDGGAYPHNSYLHMAAEIGVPGLLSFFWILFLFFRMGLRHFLRKNDYLLLGLLTGILAFLVQAFFDTHLYALQMVVLFWFMLGLSVAVMRME